MADPRESSVEDVSVFPLARQTSDALSGAVYPLTRDELILVARENEAPRTFVSMLNALPSREFTSLADAQEAIEASLRR